MAIGLVFLVLSVLSFRYWQRLQRFSVSRVPFFAKKYEEMRGGEIDQINRVFVSLFLLFVSVMMIASASRDYFGL